MIKLRAIFLTCCFLISSASFAKIQKFTSGSKQRHLLELYSSEGCSSCPPADRWLAGLRQNDQLWKNIIPVEFHVDYWNNLGWIDPHSEKRFTRRQRAYAAEWGTPTVYTPGFVLNGREWRVAQGLPKSSQAEVGQLTLKKLGANKYDLSFSANNNKLKELTGHIALLGNGLVSKVPRGENAGRTLRHEFVVLSWKKAKMQKKKNSFHATVELPAPTNKSATSYSVVSWVEKPSSQKPLQAVGGDLVSL